MEVSELELQSLYTWVDEIPLSRPKRNIARDFSDGVLLAEVVHHYFPKVVELHNYSSANGFQQKMYNWNTLNQKVLKRLGFVIAKSDCEAIANCQAGAIERVLKLVKTKLVALQEQGFTGIVAPVAAAPMPKQLTGYGAIQQQEMMQLQEQQQQQAAAMAPKASFLSGPPNAIGMRLGGMMMGGQGAGVAPEVLAEKEQTISELRETNEILETKVRKLEQLVRLKDAKIQTLMAKLQAAGMA
mmetsp:Transcript_34090/g.75593  ORF Transcript_34090/g.75593 Transcript_34090/m.75593 type:complete len:242 (-) Transcript_34090:560-1285(-)